MKLGAHVSIAGHIYEAVDRAHALGCDTMQIFSRSPRSWAQATINPADITEFKRRLKRLKIHPVFIHAPYLPNLASPDTHIYRRSIRQYIAYVREADSLGVRYFVTHMGSHKETGEEAGLQRFARALNIIFKETPRSRVMLLLENTCGSGSSLGYRFEHHRRIIRDVRAKCRVGICLDTCHAFSAGYDISGKKGLTQMVSEIEKVAGLSQLKLIHLNDSVGACNSKKDRHESIGDGKITMAGFRRIVNHPKLRNVPFILETPKRYENEDRVNMQRVRKLSKARR